MIEKKWNDNWKFWKKGNSFALSSDRSADAVNVMLPHDAMIFEKPYAESKNGGNTGYRDGGIYDYEKEFLVPEEEKGSVFYLKIEGVYMNAMVYVNGNHVVTRPYGYSTFYVDMTPWIKYGAENTLRIDVRNNCMTNSRWYSGSGIYRDVYILQGKNIHILPAGVKLETKSVDEAVAIVEVRTGIESHRNLPAQLQIEHRVKDADGEIVASVRNIILLQGRTIYTQKAMLQIPKPCLWDEVLPYLYTVETLVYEEDILLDISRDSLGIRTMTVDAMRGLRINGKETKLRGACIHHDNGLLGAATYEDAEYRRVKKLKEAGFNAIRMSHHPMSPAMVRACDELGVYVMDETFDMWTQCKSDGDYALYFPEWWERDVEAMIDKDYNHPSVIMYSLGNEIPEIGREGGILMLRRIAEKVRSLDSSRYTTIAINGVFAISDQLDQVVGDIIENMPPEERPVMGVGDNVNVFMTIMDNHMDDLACHDLTSQALDRADAFVDVIGYNYMTGRYEKDRMENPDRVIVGSETYPPEIARNWEIMKKCPAVIGDFTWTGWDYIGEAGIGVPAYHWGEGGFGANFPCQLGYCGDIDITGFRRPASYFKEIVFELRKEPYITVENPDHYGEHLIKTTWIMDDSQSSWTYPGREGCPVKVKVYSAAKWVELYLNGERIGSAPAGPDHGYTAVFETTYEPGVLLAVALEQHQETDIEISRTELRTAMESSLNVTKEAPTRECSVENLHFYSIEMKDENGTINTDKEVTLRIRVKKGKLLGFGSGNPKPLHMYSENITSTWKGRAQAILQCEEEPEFDITIETTH